MKMGKHSLATFGIGGAIILSAALGIAYIRQSQSESQLRQELTQIEARIGKLPNPISTNDLISQQQEVEAAIARTQADIKVAKSRLEAPLDSIEIADQIAKIARDCGVTLVGLDSPGQSGENVDGVDLLALTVTARGEGQVPNLVKFLNQVTARFPTAAVRSSDINVPLSDAAEKEIKPPSITFALTIYSNEGA